MSINNWIWPKKNHSFWNIKNQEYVVYINWSRNPFEDYKKMSNAYAHCGELVLTEVIESYRENIKSDGWFLTGVFLMRQSIELGLKALICRIRTRKFDMQKDFENCCHDLLKLFLCYDESNEGHLSDKEKHWLLKYLSSLELVDEKSDMFRFPFNDDFLDKYKNKFLDNVSVANNLLQAFDLTKKCINCGVVELNEDFDEAMKPEFFVYANHGIGNCYIWQPISDDGFHVKVAGYTEVANFIFSKCDNIDLNEKLYPLMFVLRNGIELCLKRLFYARVNNGVPKHAFLSKRKSHLLKKDLWKHVKPMILHYATERDEDLETIDIVEQQILELNSLDRNGDNFRYPTSYCLEYRIDNKEIDVQNAFSFLMSIINFLEGCDSMLSVISDYESEMNSYYDYY